VLLAAAAAAATLARPVTSRLDAKLQPSLLAQRPCIEGADLDRAAYLDGDDDAVARDRRLNDARAPGQLRRGLDTSLGPE